VAKPLTGGESGWKIRRRRGSIRGNKGSKLTQVPRRLLCGVVGARGEVGRWFHGGAERLARRSGVVAALLGLGVAARLDGKGAGARGGLKGKDRGSRCAGLRGKSRRSRRTSVARRGKRDEGDDRWGLPVSGTTRAGERLRRGWAAERAGPRGEIGPKR